ncbi:Fe-S biogenesis protein NfuA [Pantoea sp. Mhis]|uniref:Fe-S biogenesis protein NfuA n=1 Tax=Pantoea sp. Mhis TaxID=2576759 RepID=UPI0013585183|nr:Fe-S biogenesis protein NfuA [Pantoea sp. Mhis]MXP56528.1 Fe-S biogenesis protein NfuA [Pantoea sp. Mhis]
MIKITDVAQNHFVSLLSSKPNNTQIRVFVIHPGTPYAECGISYCPPDSVEITDTKLNYKNFSVYVDNISIKYIKDAEIDLITDQTTSQLSLKAPNIRICEISKNTPLSERIEYLLQAKINSQLAEHGGRVSLIKITDDGYAVLQFDGGCNGCSMINITLKGCIEKELLLAFPEELKGVKDITEHQHGVHSYY